MSIINYIYLRKKIFNIPKVENKQKLKKIGMMLLSAVKRGIVRNNSFVMIPDHSLDKYVGDIYYFVMGN